MRGNLVRHRNPPASRARMAGLSIVELMIAIALGLIVLAGLATLFANQSAARAEMERSSRQIENGRFAMELLGDDLRMAGFYGELSVSATGAPGAIPDPCAVDPPTWIAAMPLHVQGYDNGAGAPGCIPADIKANTDILVVRRVSTCEAGTAGCPAAAASAPYIQVSRCNAEIAAVPALGNAYEFGLSGTAPFTRTRRDCATRAALRQYIVRIYYVSDNNGLGTAVPTLKRLDFNPTTTNWVETPLVEGIEELHLEYGIDTDQDGDPDTYNANPATYVCGTCTAERNWANVMTVRVHLLARNLEPSVNYTDTKTYTLGRDAAGALVTVTPGGAFRRHAYSGLVRIVNAAERRDTPI